MNDWYLASYEAFFNNLLKGSSPSAACSRRYEFTNHKDRCPVCCPKPEPDDVFEDYELSDEVYDDDD